MKKICSIAVAAGVLTMSAACSQMITPVSPSLISMADTAAETPDSAESITDAEPVITMLSDYTVSPPYVQVKAGYRVRVVNKSGRYFQIHSVRLLAVHDGGSQPG